MATAGDVPRECPTETLARLDPYEGVADGRFRRVRVENGGGCWICVAGLRLAHRLACARRVGVGR